MTGRANAVSDCGGHWRPGYRQDAEQAGDSGGGGGRVAEFCQVGDQVDADDGDGGAVGDGRCAQRPERRGAQGSPDQGVAFGCGVRRCAGVVFRADRRPLGAAHQEMKGNDDGTVEGGG
ncbi:hypothetical protein GCM10022416_49470 [Actinomadura keratinilytica]|uniref:Uncharacterized protein n=2 Tax=Actinomadura keratinilytica TaxID=547461 RepID=A0ABP7ZAN1_9ACTN